MIARTVTVTAEFTKNIISVEASFTGRTIEVDADIITKVEHYHSEYPDYEGEYTVTPDWDAQTLATQNKVMHSDVTVEAIYLNSAQNPSGGNTVYIGGLINA